jgi:hypothetical protein
MMGDQQHFVPAWAELRSTEGSRGILLPSEGLMISVGSVRDLEETMW